MKKIILRLFLLFPIHISAIAQNEISPVAQTLQLNKENQSVYDLSPYLKVYEDTTAKLTFKEVKDLSDQYFTRVVDLKNKPASTSIVWLKFQATNQIKTRTDWVLSLGTYRSPDLITSYVINSAGQVVTAKGGAVRPSEEMAIKDRMNPMLPLSLEQGKLTTIFIEIKTVTKRQVSFNAFLETPEYLIQQSKWWNFSQASFHGSVFLFAVLGMAIFFITWDRTYLYFSLWLLNMNVIFLGVTGMASDILRLEDPSKYIFFGHITQATSAIFYFLFIKNFGQVRKLVPNLMKWINFAIGVRFALIPLQYIILLNDLNYNIITAFAVLGNIIDVPIIFVIAYQFLRTNNKVSYYVAAGSGVVFLSSFLGTAGSAILNYGTAPLIIEGGTIILMILFVTGLAQRMKTSEEEKRKAQQQLIDQLKQNRDLQDKANRELEEKVRLRTEEITRQSEEIIKQNNVLAKSNKEKEILLAEVHHRVKNNLQIVSSLLSIQSDQVIDKKAKQIVLEGQSRIQAMGFIHENIYKNESLAFIDMGTYIHTLSVSLIYSFGFGDDVQLYIQTSDLKIDVDTAIPMGLILNELITNCLKHAFTNVDSKQIEIRLYLDREQRLSLEVTDNGAGIREKDIESSFGLLLVKELTNQLEGVIETNNDKGLCTLIKFRKYKLSA